MVAERDAVELGCAVEEVLALGIERQVLGHLDLGGGERDAHPDRAADPAEGVPQIRAREIDGHARVPAQHVEPAQLALARAGDLRDDGVELGLVGGDRQDLRAGQAFDARRGRAGGEVESRGALSFLESEAGAREGAGQERALIVRTLITRPPARRPWRGPAGSR